MCALVRHFSYCISLFYYIYEALGYINDTNIFNVVAVVLLYFWDNKQDVVMSSMEEML